MLRFIEMLQLAKVVRMEFIKQILPNAMSALAIFIVVADAISAYRALKKKQYFLFFWEILGLLFFLFILRLQSAHQLEGNVATSETALCHACELHIK